MNFNCFRERSKIWVCLPSFSRWTNRTEAILIWENTFYRYKYEPRKTLQCHNWAVHLSCGWYLLLQPDAFQWDTGKRHHCCWWHTHWDCPFKKRIWAPDHNLWIYYILLQSWSKSEPCGKAWLHPERVAPNEHLRWISHCRSLIQSRVCICHIYTTYYAFLIHLSFPLVEGIYPTWTCSTGCLHIWIR